jgi:hypothetical protein
MKAKLTIILAVVMFVAVAVQNPPQTSATVLRGSPPAPALTSHGITMSGTAFQAAPFGFGQNHGRITRLYPEPTGIYFTFGGKPSQWQTAMNPANGYYYIPTTHTNYKALVDLLYLAAENDWNLMARTQPTLGVGGRADVIYLVQDFAR